jgi:hypothetical protein
VRRFADTRPNHNQIDNAVYLAEEHGSSIYNPTPGEGPVRLVCIDRLHRDAEALRKSQP